MHDIYTFPDKWVETVDKNDTNRYSDTDSAYILFALGFSKFEDDHKTVDYSQEMAKKINENYLDVLNNKVGPYIGINPKFNLMNFKSEIVAYRGFFNAKKYYALAKIWEEGNFYEKPNLKKTGGQILKADSTKLIYDLLNEIYQYLVLRFDITDENELYRIIFKELKEKYSGLILESFKNFTIKNIGIPKKWGLRDFKSIPGHVVGSMFYNTFFENTLRPGDSILAFQVKLNNLKLIDEKFQEKMKANEINEWTLSKDMINSKLNMFAVPSGISPEKLKEIKQLFLEYNIELDFDTILNFNVIKKLDQFEKLFSDDIIRRNS